MAVSKHQSPVVFYENAGKVSEKELGNELGGNTAGIRVFYFNQLKNGINCDHCEDHNEKWREGMENGQSLEAGTVTALLPYPSGVGGAVEHSVAIKWDCGTTRIYTKAQLENDIIRVFDLGPAG